MEPAERDGLKPVVPKLGSGDRGGSCERGGEVQEMRKQLLLHCSSFDSDHKLFYFFNASPELLQRT